MSFFFACLMVLLNDVGLTIDGCETFETFAVKPQ